MKTIPAGFLLLAFIVGNINFVHANRAEKLKKEIIKREIAKEKTRSKTTLPHSFVK